MATPPTKNPISSAVAKAKSALNRANSDFPSSMAVGMTPKAKPQTPVAKSKPNTINNSSLNDVHQGLKDRSDDIRELERDPNMPKFHKGGVVPGKKGEEVPILAEAGETVIPAPKSSRQSEYRKVYLARRQKRGEGGNSPAEGEKHESKKASEGIADKK